MLPHEQFLKASIRSESACEACADWRPESVNFKHCELIIKSDCKSTATIAIATRFSTKVKPLRAKLSWDALSGPCDSEACFNNGWLDNMKSYLCLKTAAQNLF